MKLRPALAFALLVTITTFNGPAHAAAEHSTHRHWAQLLHNTNDFGRWMTYAARQTGVPASKVASPAVVNANIAHYIGSIVPANWNSGRRVGTLTGMMHLMNIPSSYKFHVDSYTDARAVTTVRWIFGTNPHTPIARLTWAYTPSRWTITGATFVRNS